MHTGKFIVIEGSDGSGKGVQTERLVARLEQEGRQVVGFDFPRYRESSSWFVKEYLNGQFGTLEDINPRTASLFYALDRYAAAPTMRAALRAGDIVISNRYVASNLGHQGGKFTDQTQRTEYFNWNLNLEFEINGIPRPDCNIVLFVPPAVAQTLVDQKVQRQYLGNRKRDLHETDLGHLTRSYEAYRHLVELFPQSFIPVECFENDALLSIDAVHEKVWNIVAQVIGAPLASPPEVLAEQPS